MTAPDWRRSSKCEGGSCVEVAFANIAWQRSSKCEQGACVEVAFNGDEILMRDGKNAASPVLRFTRAEWDAFVAGVLDGEFAG